MGVLLVVLLLVLACMLLLADYTLQKGRARHLCVHTAGIRQQMADLSFKRSQMKSNVMVTVKHNNVVAWTWTRKSRCFMYDNVEPSKELYETKVVTEEQFFDIYFPDFPRHKALSRSLSRSVPRGLPMLFTGFFRQVESTLAFGQTSTRPCWSAMLTAGPLSSVASPPSSARTVGCSRCPCCL